MKTVEQIYSEYSFEQAVLDLEFLIENKIRIQNVITFNLPQPIAQVFLNNKEKARTYLLSMKEKGFYLSWEKWDESSFRLSISVRVNKFLEKDFQSEFGSVVTPEKDSSAVSRLLDNNDTPLSLIIRDLNINFESWGLKIVNRGYHLVSKNGKVIIYREGTRTLTLTIGDVREFILSTEEKELFLDYLKEKIEDPGLVIQEQLDLVRRNLP